MPSARAGRRRRLDRRALLVLPALIVSAFLFLYPVGMLLLRSVLEPVPGLQNYRTVASQPVYAATLWNTVVISASVTAICILVGYPFAYTIASAGPRVRRWLIFAVLVPFWSSVLVRSFAWLVLLQRRGLVNQILIALGVIDRPAVLVHDRAGVLIGMAHVLLPFMVLPLYAVMIRVDGAFMKAAASLGANPVTSFFRVYLPLTQPGLLNGASLVFVLGLGYFVVPALLGGPGETMIAQSIQSQIADFGDWGLAGALSVVLLVGVAVVFALIRRVVTRPGPARDEANPLDEAMVAMARAARRLLRRYRRFPGRADAARPHHFVQFGAVPRPFRRPAGPCNGTGTCSPIRNGKTPCSTPCRSSSRPACLPPRSERRPRSASCAAASRAAPRSPAC